VWGQLLRDLPGYLILRFTPTCVGTIFAAALFAYGYAVHPHVCGDNRDLVSYNGDECGSPPRVWGQCRADCRA